jgi:hypothetical protein
MITQRSRKTKTVKPSAVLACAVALVAAVLIIPTSAHPDRAHYRFTTIDLPRELGTPGLATDVQSLWLNDDGVFTAEYQQPASGICCGLALPVYDNMHMAVRRDGRWREIIVAGSVTTAGAGVNNRGEMALAYRLADEAASGMPWHSAIYDLSRRELTPLLNPPDHPGGVFALGINDRGQIAADIYDEVFGLRAEVPPSLGFVGDPRHFEVFQFPGGDVAQTFAQMVGNTGTVVGAYVLADTSIHAYKRRRGQFTNIDVPGSLLSIALGINDDNVIVGGYMNADFRIYGFVLDKGRFSDLRVPNSTLTVPWSINNKGQIAGTYSTSDDPLFNGAFHGFIATPVQDRD